MALDWLSMAWWTTRLLSLRSFICEKICGGELKKLREKQDRLVQLKAELNDNLVCSRHPSGAGGLVLLTYQFAVWDQCRGDLDNYPPQVQVALERAYRRMREANSMVDQFNRTRDGRLQGMFETRSHEVCSDLEQAIAGLEGFSFSR